MESPLVTVNQGQLRGGVHRNIDGGKIFSFLGIPFAKPPVGELRFKAPLPGDSWIGVRDATKVGKPCYCVDMLTGVLDGSEDCLFLNVFTRELPQPDQEPVMIWLHGGAFMSGSASPELWGPEFLLLEDIVLVTINYRLGALGFLSVEDPSLGVPGNAGMKDQILAFKWVQENIKYFNGDPNNVTLFGESAGGSSIHYHVLSPASKGLFHKAIMQSGVSINPMKTGFPVAVEFAKFMGHDVSSEREALEVLKSVPVEVLYQNQSQFVEVRGRPFAPVPEYPNDTAFITKHAADILKSGEYNKVPMIFGYNSREGMLLEAMAKITGKKSLTYPPGSEEAILACFGLTKGTEIAEKTYKKVKEVYFNSEDVEDDARVLASDFLYIAGIIASVKKHLETSQEPIYLYRMSLTAGLNFFKNLSQLHHLKGTCHGDDLGYLFKSIKTPDIEPGSLEDISVRRFVTLWTNFAKYGNPTPNEKELGVKWPPVEQGRTNYLDIGSELTVGANPESGKLDVWKEFFQLGL